MSSCRPEWWLTTLQVRGHGVDFNHVSEILGLSPTQTRKEGQRFKYGDVAEDDAWMFEVDTGHDRPLADQLLLLQKSLGANVGRLRPLSRNLDVHIYCSYMLDFAQGYFELGPAELEFLSSTGVPLIISLFSFGAVHGQEPCSVFETHVTVAALREYEW